MKLMIILSGGQAWEMRYDPSRYRSRQAERVMLDFITENGPDPEVWTTLVMGDRLVFPDGT